MIATTLNGSQYYQKQASAVPTGDSLRLQAGAKGVCWVLYQFPDLLQSDKPIEVQVNLTPPLPSSYFIGVADYAHDIWRWTTVTVPTGTDHVGVPDIVDAITPGGNLYLAVAVYDMKTANIASVKLRADLIAPPPQALTASDGTSGSTITLNWINPAESYAGLTYDGIMIERALDMAGPWVNLAELPPGVGYMQAYEDVHAGSGPGLNDIPYNTPVYYRIRTLQGGEAGPPSLVDSGYRLLGDVTLSATKGTHHDKVVVTWTAVPGADGYDLYYKQTRYGQAYWVVLAQIVGGGMAQFEHTYDASAKPCWYNTSYDYRAKARYLDDQSLGWGTLATGWRVLPDVTGLAATDGGYADRIVLTWGAVPGADGYDVEYRQTWHGDGSFTLLTHLTGGGVTSFDHTSSSPVGKECQANYSYTYRVFGTFAGDTSVNPSNEDRGHYGPGAWPMFHHDPRHTGRSEYVGPQTSGVAWTFNVGGVLPQSSPTIGPDETVCIGNTTTDYPYLYAVNPDGSEKWRFDMGANVYSSAAIREDGMIFCGSMNGKLYAIKPDGTEEWSYTCAGEVRSSPVFGTNGKIYVGGGSNLYSINPDGTLDWWYPTAGAVWSSPALDADGNIVVGSSDKKVYAIRPDGTKYWSYTTADPITYSSPLIDEDGNVYIGTQGGYVYSLTAAGSFNWRYLTGGELESSPALSQSSRVLIGCDDRKVYCLDRDGDFQWSFEGYYSGFRSSPAVGGDGIIYCAAYDLYALDDNGAFQWAISFGNPSVLSSASVSVDGAVYIAGANGNLNKVCP